MLKYRVVYLEQGVRKIVDVECRNFTELTAALGNKQIWIFISTTTILSIVLINTEPELIN